MAANSIGVWACSFYMFDEEGNEILNKDGSVKVFDAPDLDWSHIAEYVEPDDLAEVNVESNEKLDKAIELLNEMVCQADEDTPSEYRTRHFRECMNECNEFLDKEYQQ